MPRTWALVAGEPLRNIAKRTGTSVAALHRHRPHVSAKLTKAREAKEAASADGLLAGIAALRERLERALEDAQAAKDVASLSRELRETIRLMLELEGRLRQSAHVQVAVTLVQSLEWLSLRTRMVQALEPFPEALTALVQVLQEEKSPDGQPARR
ncbi:MAG TPA: hypothetical protein VKT83_03655 [bacterium]|nr:hypothetical protein [bacterium]